MNANGQTDSAGYELKIDIESYIAISPWCTVYESAELTNILWSSDATQIKRPLGDV